MDSSALVITGQKLLEALRRQSFSVVMAAWVHDSDRGWRLLIVPSDFHGIRNVYQKVSQILITESAFIGNLEVSRIDVLDPNGTIAKALQFYILEAQGDVAELDGLRLGPYYYDRAIILG